MTDTQCAETPIRDHVARFWRHLETETARILVDLKRVVGHDAPDGPVEYWDGATFSDDVAKALVAERAALRAWAEDEQQKRYKVEEDRLEERSENARLRVVLQDFADNGFPFDWPGSSSPMWDACHYVQKKAAAALVQASADKTRSTS